MANESQLVILNQGVEYWNQWRTANKEVRPNLERADLSNRDLRNANFKDAIMKRVNFSNSDLRGANFDSAYLRRANFTNANLSSASLAGSYLRWAVLHRSNLHKAYLRRADLSYADLQYADMSYSVLEYARLVNVNLEGAAINNTLIYGVSVWNVHGTPINQSSLTITPRVVKRNWISDSSADIRVDDIEVAQFIYMLLNNSKIRNVISAMTSRMVLILGRFTPERKAILEIIAVELRKHNLLPVIFDFERASSRDFTESVKVLAGLSLFVIADITNPRSVNLELQALVPDYAVPFLPIIEDGEKPIAMFKDLGKYPWLLELVSYNITNLQAGFKAAIIDRAWEKHRELEQRKAMALQTKSIGDFAIETKLVTDQPSTRI